MNPSSLSLFNLNACRQVRQKNMYKSLKFISVFAGGLLLWGIYAYGESDKKETREVPSFEEVGISVTADVTISQGKETSLILVGDSYTLEHIQTNVLEGKLKIKYSTWKWNNYPKVKIYITSPDWRGIYVSGSANVINETPLKSERLILNLSGSGNIQLDRLKVIKAETRISGSGSIQVAGSQKAGSLTVAVSGSGHVNALKLETGNVDVKIAGSGNVKVFADKKLNAIVAGSGSVYYRGSGTVDAKVSGSGKVRKVK